MSSELANFYWMYRTCPANFENVQIVCLFWTFFKSEKPSKLISRKMTNDGEWWRNSVTCKIWFTRVIRPVFVMEIDEGDLTDAVPFISFSAEIQIYNGAQWAKFRLCKNVKMYSSLLKKKNVQLLSLYILRRFLHSLDFLHWVLSPMVNLNLGRDADFKQNMPHFSM